MSLLEVNGLNSYYGDSHILFDVSLHVEKNEVVALLGRNGAGKSTTFKSLMGVVKPRTGSVKMDGVELAGKKPHSIALLGMQLVHEERRIFGSLTVEENIILAGLTAQNKWGDLTFRAENPVKSYGLTRTFFLSGIISSEYVDCSRLATMPATGGPACLATTYVSLAPIPCPNRYLSGKLKSALG